MPAKVTTWNKAVVQHVLVLVKDDVAVQIEIGYEMTDVADPGVKRREIETLLPPGPRFAAADALVKPLVGDVRVEEGLEPEGRG